MTRELGAARTEGPPAVHRQGVTRDVTVQIAGRFANLVLGVFVTIVVVRSLGDVGFGEWSSLLAVIALAQALSDLGFTQVTVRRAAEDPRGEPEWLGALVQLKLALSIIAFGVSGAVVIAISTSTEMRTAGLIVSLTLLLAAPSALRAIFQLRIRNDLVILVITVNSLLWALAAVAVLAWGESLVALALGFAAALAVATALQVVLALRLGTVRLRGVRHRWPEMLRVGIPVAIGSALILSYGRIDQILVLELAGAEDAGLYGAVYRIFDQSQFVAISVATTIFPLLAASYATDPGRFRNLLQTAAEVMLAPMIGGFVLVLVYAEDLVTVLFGSEFAPAADALIVLTATLIPVSLGYLVGMVVILTETQRAFMAVAAAGLVFNVAANIAVIPIWGFVAAAWVTLLTELLVLGLASAFVRRRLPATLTLGRVPRIAGAALVVLILLMVLRALSAPVSLAILVVAISYPAALLAVRAVSIAELASLRRRATTS